MKKKWGVLLINKPTGISSFGVVAKIRKLLKIKKVGHSGTLDPFASGLLQICFGKATKVINYLVSNTKTYEATVVLGKKTDTGDSEGKIINEEIIDFEINNELLNSVIEKILQISEQTPPRYSAVRINGKRAYQLARENQDFELKKRPVKIYDFEVLDFSNDKITYKTTVSKGTYIRVLSETLAEMIGTIGYTINLKRTKIGETSLENAVDLADLTEENIHDFVLSIDQVLTEFPSIKLNSKQIEKFKNGVKIKFKEDNLTRVLVKDSSGNGIGFAEISQNTLLPKNVFI